MVRIPFKTIRQEAHIRPTTRDRAPFLGEHPILPRVFIFNGLGALGLSLAPLNSERLLNLILHQKPLPREVDIKRFSSLFSPS
jgi:glycine/D-amino acid oxidase-like deaminating enzyme